MRPPQLGPGDRSPTSGRTGSVGGDPRYTWWVGMGDWPTGQVTVVTSGQAVPQPVQTPCVRLPLPVLPHVCGPRPPGAVPAGRASPSPFLSFKEVHETQAGRRAREARGRGCGRDARHDLRVCGHVLLHAGAALPLLRPARLRHHRHLLPGLLHGPLQLPVAAPPEAAVLQMQACTLLLLVLFIYDVFFVFITPFLTKSGNSIMVEVATGPSDSATHEKLPMVLKVPRLNASPLALCDRPFSLLGFGDILVPGLLVAYCHRFDIQVQSSRVYFVACTIEGPTSVAVGASLCRRPAAPGGLRRSPLPAASRPRSGPVPSARGAAPRVVRARGERGRRAPPEARESGRPRPRPLGLGEGADSAPAPRDWTRAAPNLVLWPGRCARPAPARPHPGPQPCSELAWLPSPRPAEANPARAPLPAAVVPREGRGRHFRRWPRTRPVWCLPCCCFPSGPGRERAGLWLLVEGRLCSAGPPGVWTGRHRSLGGPW
ncbi:signal peptide peptidase-like 2B isoform X5 [Orcinus orca]|uniref:signal peptide peptidase-like 2B isoform X5 n=1 Tax=Orcinus orca TaxID=9733 RepID=UPI001441BC73|nr:signal peptide peptidase-like 2B isoform X5 [Orcinus orca]